MARRRLNPNPQFSPDGPHLSAILHALYDLHDLLDERLPKAGTGEPEQVKEPAPPAAPTKAVPISEPAPVVAPEVTANDEEDEEGGLVAVTEPAPAASPALPSPPPRAGRGAGLEPWREFAAAAEVAIPDGARRDDIITACERAGVIDPAQ
ncbi:hypothetical protein AB0B94_30650 [Micromonospora sp. NPDC048986]|uniref:hypothetical protein n=1 Tax=Micromonospora sp. NPDC048986 TaxID=3155644 RepID=UPI0033DECD5D